MAQQNGISRRKFIKGVAGAAAVAGVGPAFITKKAHAQTTLQIWHTESSDVSVKAVQKVADRFEQLHPGVKVEQQGIGWASIGSKLTTSLAAGTPPDICQIQPQYFITFQKRGYLVPLDDAAAIVDFFGDVLFGGALTPDERQAAIDFLGEPDSGPLFGDAQIREVVAFLLGYPQFQEQ